MLADFKIQATDATHFSQDIAKVIDVLAAEGINYRLGPMGTVLEGDWPTIMGAIRKCHEMLIGHHGRVITTITIDDRKDQPHHLDEMVGSVERHRPPAPKSRKRVRRKVSAES